MDLIHYQNVINAFAIFVHRSYLLKTVFITLATMYVTVAMVAAMMSAVRS